ncbi:MAG: DUF389 domain-containing protein [Gemmatimonadales bacterium]|nr:DUF389 domain-containing protein [Gemmatimonadales bacterium]
MTEEETPERSNPQAFLRLLRRMVRPMQARAAAAVGIDATARIETVEEMLDLNKRRAPGYWIQLVLAAGIAILGLVLNSTAIVIGAMLVSPLMGPIVELGMGFAVGSSYLVIRSALRVGMSIIVIVGGTALFTVLLPFHEVTNEIATRTVPTALDLMVAIFSALAAAYTTVRRTSDTTAAAAGTAVAIALVPPVSVIGYGIGTADAAITGGSALLFTANFSAILFFAVLTFLVLGYDAVDAGSLEARALTSRATRFDRIAARGQGMLHRIFQSRFGPLMRIAVPVAFFAAVYFPLTSALEEVSWQVQRSAAVRQILAELVPNAVQQVVRIERGRVELRLLVVSDSIGPVDVERRLSTAIAAATGVEPVVQVVAVADLAALARARSSQVEKVPMAAEIIPAVDQARGRLSTILERSWPRGAGALAGWRLEVAPAGPPTVVVHHLGPPMGPVAEELLATALAPALDIRPRIADRPLDVAILSPGRDTAAWLARVDTALQVAPWVNSVLACLAVRALDSASTWEDSLRRRATLNPRTVRIDTASQWQFQWRRGPCNPARRDTTSAPGTPARQ